ncbi:flagellar biosynthesis protein FlhF [Marinobacter nanhaiticus D15-8W]|uniref:Flagellar biosynthesis protein FlhF n=1 Tax=Marinobacter nanhaiticus D15-8W TaxID=626887 RepID=N6X0T4_9GAMM|nr:flagellar biosynthesis protein FlhF [Marinobacter nanhaiticus]ENO17047.1 flagellar biosynthesis protein FlhF [Marinobacter nanhaiticus D15-8W]BES71957.1 flagellar biosynthesis protein FlhF [Marinobacter nanhaiticus D15-8W]
MKVKRFFAPTMSQALKMVRLEMGDDAVILSNRRVDDGVEIVTALDYDENMARQRLGNAAVEATNGARLAEMQADQHRRLEEELGRSRQRIREIRERRSPQPAPEPKVATVAAAPSQDPTHAALEAMRAEIHSLRDMVNGRQGDAAPVVKTSAPEVDASHQRLTERLEEFGLSSQLAGTLARSSGSGRLEEGWKKSLRTLAAGVRTQDQEIVEQGGIVALVGPTGSGKTTTIGKMAARYVLRHGADSLALVTTDRYRVAAHEQLFVFGRILNVPVRVVDESHTLDQILDDLSDKRLVLVDTAGLTHSDRGHQEQLEELASSYHPIKPYLVLAATSQPRIMKSTWHCYKMAKPAGCIMTKLDEALTLGEVLGFAMETGLRVAYYTDGQRIPEDIHPAQSVPLVRLGVERLREARETAMVAAGA